MFVGAGLISLPARVAEATSHAERPYFLQAIGKHVWDNAVRHPISADHVHVGIRSPGSLVAEPSERSQTLRGIVSQVDTRNLERLAASRGRNPTDLIAWLEDALERAAPATRQPERDWSAAQAAVLAAEGIDVMPLCHDEADMIGAGHRQYLAMLSTGLSVAETAARIGLSPSRIRQMIAEHRLYAVRPRDKTWVLPAWQFDGQRIVPGIEAVNQALGHDLHPLTVSGFMHSSQPELDAGGQALSPLDWLRGGGSASAVMALAESL